MRCCAPGARNCSPSRSGSRRTRMASGACGCSRDKRMGQAVRCLVGFALGSVLWGSAWVAWPGEAPEGPSLAEAERIWQGLVEALAPGGRAGLLRLTHSARRHLVADPLRPL